MCMLKRLKPILSRVWRSENSSALSAPALGCSPSRSGQIVSILRAAWKRLLLASLLLGGLFLIVLLAWPMETRSYLEADASPEMLDRSGRLLYAFLNDRQQWCFERPLNQMHPLLLQATIAAEDQRFERHWGVDPWAISRAFWQNVRWRRVASGASTLTMQTVKLGGIASSSIPGKIAQIGQALRLERRASKDNILQAYLNRAPYGLNLVGCEAAARRYFGKPSLELTLSEAALLAALPKSPVGLMPLRNPERALRRRNYVLDRMLEEKFISPTEHAEASHAPLGAEFHAFPNLAPHLALRLRPAIEAQRHLTTTLDLVTQQRAERLLNRHLRQYENEIDNGAVVIADPDSMQILARVGSGNFFSGDARGAQFDATRALRSPGSTLKPFTYALALETDNLYPTEVLLDETLDYGLYDPKNFDLNYRGLVPAGQALAESLNVPAVQVFDRLGPEKVYDFLNRAGLDTFTREAEYYGMGLALGNCEVRLDQLAAAYCMLANLGEYRPLVFQDDATSSATPTRLLSADVCVSLYQMLDRPLPGEVDRQALGAVDTRTHVCWKTGTSTGNRDAWSFLYNRQYVVGVWLGNSSGRSSRLLVGSSVALPLATQIFRTLEPRNTSAWPATGEALREVKICARSGLPAAEWCPATRPALIARKQLLHRICDVHWPEPGRAEESDAIVERWPGSSRYWDLASIKAPVIRSRESAPAPGASSKQTLEILNPPAASEYILTGETRADRIRLRSSRDAEATVHWYLDDQYVGTAQQGKPLYLNLTEGEHRVACMTSEGEVRQVNFKVLEAGRGDYFTP